MSFSNATILINRKGMGEAPQELQKKLIGTYLKLIDQNDMLPGVICFYAEGVRLVTVGSKVLDTLRSLESKGVRLVLCGTCLDFFGLSEQVEVGIVGGMTDIIEAQSLAEKVITL